MSAGMVLSWDDLLAFKTFRCKEDCTEDACLGEHKLEQPLRRNPIETIGEKKQVRYSPLYCKNQFNQTGQCKKKDQCPFSHTTEESSYHPTSYLQLECPTKHSPSERCPYFHNEAETEYGVEIKQRLENETSDQSPNNEKTKKVFSPRDVLCSPDHSPPSDHLKNDMLSISNREPQQNEETISTVIPTANEEPMPIQVETSFSTETNQNFELDESVDSQNEAEENISVSDGVAMIDHTSVNDNDVLMSSGETDDDSDIPKDEETQTEMEIDLSSQHHDDDEILATQPQHSLDFVENEEDANEANSEDSEDPDEILPTQIQSSPIHVPSSPQKESTNSLTRPEISAAVEQEKQPDEQTEKPQDANEDTILQKKGKEKEIESTTSKQNEKKQEKPNTILPPAIEFNKIKKLSEKQFYDFLVQTQRDLKSEGNKKRKSSAADQMGFFFHRKLKTIEKEFTEDDMKKLYENLMIIYSLAKKEVIKPSKALRIIRGALKFALFDKWNEKQQATVRCAYLVFVNCSDPDFELPQSEGDEELQEMIKSKRHEAEDSLFAYLQGSVPATSSKKHESPSKLRERSLTRQKSRDRKASPPVAHNHRDTNDYQSGIPMFTPIISDEGNEPSPAASGWITTAEPEDSTSAVNNIVPATPIGSGWSTEPDKSAPTTNWAIDRSKETKDNPASPIANNSPPRNLSSSWKQSGTNENSLGDSGSWGTQSKEDDSGWTQAPTPRQSQKIDSGTPSWKPVIFDSTPAANVSGWGTISDSPTRNSSPAPAPSSAPSPAPSSSSSHNDSYNNRDDDWGHDSDRRETRDRNHKDNRDSNSSRSDLSRSDDHRNSERRNSSHRDSYDDRRDERDRTHDSRHPDRRNSRDRESQYHHESRHDSRESKLINESRSDSHHRDTRQGYDSRHNSPYKRARSPSMDRGNSPKRPRSMASGTSNSELQRDLQDLIGQLKSFGGDPDPASVDRLLYTEVVGLVRTNIQMANQLTSLTTQYRAQVQRQTTSISLLLQKIEQRSSESLHIPPRNEPPTELLQRAKSLFESAKSFGL